METGLGRLLETGPGRIMETGPAAAISTPTVTQPVAAPVTALKEANHVDTEDDIDLFEPSLLLSLDLSRHPCTFQPPLSVQAPGEGLRVRPLNSGDYGRGFLQLLGQLTTVGEVCALLTNI